MMLRAVRSLSTLLHKQGVSDLIFVETNLLCDTIPFQRSEGNVEGAVPSFFKGPFFQ
jgi:hypothetical protein